MIIIIKKLHSKSLKFQTRLRQIPICIRVKYFCLLCAVYRERERDYLFCLACCICLVDGWLILLRTKYTNIFTLNLFDVFTLTMYLHPDAFIILFPFSRLLSLCKAKLCFTIKSYVQEF